MDLIRHRAQLYYTQWGLIPLIAPSDFDVDAVNAYQDINIFQEFVLNSNGNKRLVFSIGSSNLTTLLPVVTNCTYQYKQEISGVQQSNTITSGTVTWTTGSIKRHVFLIGTNNSINFPFPTGAIWGYLGDKITAISHVGNTLRYIHTYNNYSIGSIGDSVFGDKTSLTGILNLSTNIISIGNQSFIRCTGIVGTLVIPSSIILIRQAFQGCTGLTKLIFNEGLITLDNYAFYQCTSIVGDLVLPNSLVTIKGNVFQYCPFDRLLSLGNSLATIGSSAFQECKFTSQLNLPNTLITIGSQAFYKVPFTGQLNLPASLTTIGSGAFQECKFTGGLTIPNTVISIDYGAFRSITTLTGSLTILGANTSLSLSTTISPFYSCTGFTALNLPSGYVGNGTAGKLFDFSNNFSAASINQSILNLPNNFGTLTIGTTNKTRWTTAYPSAQAVANARGITIA